jgi:hypothetical protein
MSPGPCWGDQVVRLGGGGRARTCDQRIMRTAVRRDPSDLHKRVAVNGHKIHRSPPVGAVKVHLWGRLGSNQRPPDYESGALTN